MKRLIESIRRTTLVESLKYCQVWKDNYPIQELKDLFDGDEFRNLTVESKRFKYPQE